MDAFDNTMRHVQRGIAISKLVYDAHGILVRKKRYYGIKR